LHSRAVTFVGIGVPPAFTGSSRVASPAGARWRVGLADDSPVLAGRLVEPLELAVGDPDDPRVQLVERAEVVITEDRPPQLAQPAQVGGVDDPVLGAGLQVDGHPSGEGRDDHVRDRAQLYISLNRQGSHASCTEARCNLTNRGGRCAQGLGLLKPGQSPG
jgi:hypothetical protein